VRIGPEAEKAAEPRAASVTVYPDGPLLLRGDAEVRSLTGEVLSTGGRTVALCRCGHSATVPFCDGTHKAAKFRCSTGAP
jgi:CDGSH-type Zn-finger protein